MRPSFLSTTPAKNPRTECCWPPVAFMMMGIVAPWGRRNSSRTAACLDFAGCLGWTAFRRPMVFFVAVPDLTLRAGLVLVISISSCGVTAHAVTSAAPRRPDGAGGEEIRVQEEGDFRRAPLFVVAPHTLLSAAKSSGKRAILWLICPSNDHLRIRKSDGRRLLTCDPVALEHAPSYNLRTTPPKSGAIRENDHADATQIHRHRAGRRRYACDRGTSGAAAARKQAYHRRRTGASLESQFTGMALGSGRHAAITGAVHHRARPADDGRGRCRPLHHRAAEPERPQ